MKKKSETINAEFEIIETKLIPATTETKGVQLFSPDNKEQVIQAFVNAASLSFSLTSSDCKKLVKESAKLTIKDRHDVEGYEKVKEANWKLVKARTGTETERKALTDPFNKIKSGIDNVAKNEILGVTAKEEERTKALLDQWKQWEKEAADEVERKAKEKLDLRISELKEVGLEFDGSFYSVGSVSVDLVTIANLSDEHFEELKKRSNNEFIRISEEKRIENLHLSRKELLTDLWPFLVEEVRVLNFGEMSEEFFDSIKLAAEIKKNNFETEQNKQKEESERLEKERKELNYEKRSFKLEKLGFEVNEDGDLIFLNAFGSCRWDKSQLESLMNGEFEERLEKSIEAKKRFEEEAKIDEEEKKIEAKNKSEIEKQNSRRKIILEIGFEETDGGFAYHNNFVGYNIVFDSNDEEFSTGLIRWAKAVDDKKNELENKKNEERLKKLPEIDKAERYIMNVMEVEIPSFKTAEIAEVIAVFKNEIKLAANKAFETLKK